MENPYKNIWKKHYGEYPYSNTSPEQDLSPQEYSESLLEVFKDAGIYDDMKTRPLKLLASSVSRGTKDWSFLELLDHQLDEDGINHTSQAILFDYAVRGNGQSVIEPPKYDFRHIDWKILIADAVQLPFEEGTIDVLYERLGAIYHAADEDNIKKEFSTRLSKLVGEYYRVLKPGGKLLVDYFNTRNSISTIGAIIEDILSEDIEKWFNEKGFDLDMAGQRESYLILEKRE